MNSENIDIGSQPENNSSQLILASEEFKDKLQVVLYGINEQLNELNCCYQFYHPMLETLFAHTEPWCYQSRWLSGLSAVDQWLLSTSDNLIKQVHELSDWIETVNIKKK